MIDYFEFYTHKFYNFNNHSLNFIKKLYSFFVTFKIFVRNYILL